MVKSQGEARLQAASSAPTLRTLRSLAPLHPWLRDLLAAHDDQQGRMGGCLHTEEQPPSSGGAPRLDPVPPPAAGASELQVFCAAAARYEASMVALAAVDYDDLLALAAQLLARERPRRLAVNSIQ
jgi:hypothetical protein